MIKFNQGDFCGEYIFPETWTSKPFFGCEEFWTRSVCSNKVFYPGAWCAVDNDCKYEICVQGGCVDPSPLNYEVSDSNTRCAIDDDCRNKICVQGACVDLFNYRFFSYTGLGTEPVKAMGTKKILIFSFGDRDLDKCVISQPEDINFAFDKIENYYDEMANQYLEADSSFINFEYVYIGQFNKSEFIYPNKPYNDIVNEIISECNLNMPDYDFAIFDQVGVGMQATNEGVLGAVGNNPHTYTSLAHEFAHVFGCRDLHTNLGGSYQWDKSLMGQRRFNKPCLQDSSNYCNLDVCFAEMGWADLNSNGIIDVSEGSANPIFSDVILPGTTFNSEELTLITQNGYLSSGRMS